jgi:hypothetical protein
MAVISGFTAGRAVYRRSAKRDALYSLSAPRQHRTYRVVEYCGHQRAYYPCTPPTRIAEINQFGHADVCEGANAADKIEYNEPF